MKLCLMSDLHLEFHRDGGASFCEEILDKTPTCDVIALAGDIGVLAYDYEQMLYLISKLANKSSKTIFIPGNHCFYGRFYEEGVKTLESLREDFKYDSAVEICHTPKWIEYKDYNILAGTLWFANLMPDFNTKSWLNDFNVKHIEQYIYTENNAFIRELELTDRKNIITISHHSPTYKSVGQRFLNSPLNQFFCNDMDDLLAEKEVILSCHGHLHDAVDYMLGSTRVVSSPAGYPREIPLDWKPKVIEID